MSTVEVCLTPELIHQHDLSGKVVVVVDIFRATSCMVTGLAEGVEAIYPVKTVEECFELGELGMVTAGERNGLKVDGFQIGNSPFHYMEPNLMGRKVAVTTTNGTLAIEKSRAANDVVIGAFLNMGTTAQYLQKSGHPLVIHCAGWKGTPNLEDTLYAGALVERLARSHRPEGDSAFLSHTLYSSHKDNLLEAGKQSGHAQRLAGYGITKDIEFCLQNDVYDLLVKLEGDCLTGHSA